MLTNSSKEQISDDLIEKLKCCSLPESIEILANVFINLSVHHLEDEYFDDLKELDTISTLTKFLLRKDICNQETLPLALMRQGLQMLIWLDNSRFDNE